MSSVETLKRVLKSWENKFYKSHQRKPCKADIKKEPEIEAKYREYKKLKYGDSKTKEHENHSIETRNLHYHGGHHGSHQSSHKHSKNNSILCKPDLVLQTPPKSSPNRLQMFEQPSPSKQIIDVGPTPQLNGRILGIFEISKTPVQTPTKDIDDSPTHNSIVITPSIKRKLDFSEVMSDNEDAIDDIKNLPSKKPNIFNRKRSEFVRPTMETKHNLDKFSTPTHNKVIKEIITTPLSAKNSPAKNFIENTPVYLSQGTTVLIESPKTVSKQNIDSKENDISLISPSVFRYENRITFGRKSHGIKRKTLSQIFNEVEEIKKDLNDDQKMQLEIEMDLKEQQLIMDIEKEDIKNGLAGDDDRYDLVGDMGRSTNEFESELQDDVAPAVNADDHKTSYWLMKKRPKRQTRRVKMKGRGVQEEAAVTDTNEIDQNIRELQNQQFHDEDVHKVLGNDSISDNSDIENISDSGSDNDELISRLQRSSENNAKNGTSLARQKYISNNFKKYKLKRGGNRGRFRRR